MGYRCRLGSLGNSSTTAVSSDPRGTADSSYSKTYSSRPECGVTVDQLSRG